MTTTEPAITKAIAAAIRAASLRARVFAEPQHAGLLIERAQQWSAEAAILADDACCEREP